MESDRARMPGLPPPQGLYDPARERDACGVGFIAHIKNKKSHDIVARGLQILDNLDHRGAIGADPLAGDGAGILIQIPDRFLRAECARLGIDLPAAGDYAVGQVFLPRDARARRACEQAFERTAKREGQRVLGWRDVPVDRAYIGESVKALEPITRQVFVARGAKTRGQDAFERKLFVIRKQA
ncbi:MAG: glutamate synthase subunit alpha, partial [Alphaproteobacteria bacterium]|nr:glutamate synthase subunit alpha [Alphaproteobacteria bacterium]